MNKQSCGTEMQITLNVSVWRRKPFCCYLFFIVFVKWASHINAKTSLVKKTFLCLIKGVTFKFGVNVQILKN